MKKINSRKIHCDWLRHCNGSLFFHVETVRYSLSGFFFNPDELFKKFSGAINWKGMIERSRLWHFKLLSSARPFKKKKKTISFFHFFSSGLCFSICLHFKAKNVYFDRNDFFSLFFVFIHAVIQGPFFFLLYSLVGKKILLFFLIQTFTCMVSNSSWRSLTFRRLQPRANDARRS